MLPLGQRLYVIGDIHGRLDLLRQLMARINQERMETPSQLIFLGDYIDRGLHSRQVLDELLAIAAQEQVKPIFLLGNHEQVMRDILRHDDAALMHNWMRFGGVETLLSYGIRPPAHASAEAAAETITEIKSRLPARHVAFLEQLASSYTVGDYFFCHAGIRPEKPLREQKEADLAWIRHDFLQHKGPHEKVIVHGHTISKEPEMLPHRINIDTGAYATSVLTALALEDDKKWLLQTV